MDENLYSELLNNYGITNSSRVGQNEYKLENAKENYYFLSDNEVLWKGRNGNWFKTTIENAPKAVSNAIRARNMENQNLFIKLKDNVVRIKEGQFPIHNQAQTSKTHFINLTPYLNLPPNYEFLLTGQEFDNAGISKTLRGFIDDGKKRRFITYEYDKANDQYTNNFSNTPEEYRTIKISEGDPNRKLRLTSFKWDVDKLDYTLGLGENTANAQAPIQYAQFDASLSWQLENATNKKQVLLSIAKTLEKMKIDGNLVLYG